MKNLIHLLYVLFLIFLLNHSMAVAQWNYANGPYGAYTYGLMTKGSNVYAATFGGVFVSTDNGTSWLARNNSIESIQCYSLAGSGNIIFVGTYFGNGVYVSTDDGNNWAFSGLNGLNVIGLAYSSSNVFAATSNGIYLTTNTGQSWIQVNNGIPTTDTRTIAVSGSSVFAGTAQGVYMTTNNGTTWTQMNNGLTTPSVRYLMFSGTNLFAGTLGGGVFLSTDNGNNWNQVNNGLTNNTVYVLTYTGSNIFAGTAGGVFLTTNNGSNWSLVNNGMNDYVIRSMTANGSTIFAGTVGDVFKSTNNGSSWELANSGLTNVYIYDLAVKGTKLFAGSGGSGIFMTPDNGGSWMPVNSGLPNSYTGTNFIYSLFVSGNNIFAGLRQGGVYLSTDEGLNWVAVNNGIPSSSDVKTFAQNGTNIFAGTSSIGVYLTTNNGTSWTPVNNGLTTQVVNELVVKGSDIYAATTGGGVFKTTNNGQNWFAVNNGMSNNVTLSLATIGTYIFAGNGGAPGRDINRSSDDGASWVPLGYTAGDNFRFAVTSNYLFVGQGANVLYSDNFGSTFSDVSTGLPLNPSFIYALTIKDNFIFAGLYISGVWFRPLFEIIPVELTSFTADVSENDVLVEWITATETNNQGFEIQRRDYGNEFAAIGFVEGNGTTTQTHSYSYTDKNLNGGKYYYRLKQIDFDGSYEYSNVIEVSVNIPTVFSLEQNYPNPFNPATIIKYSIPENSYVTLKIYDILGDEIETLVNEEKPAGTYELEFNSHSSDVRNLTSGVYFYQLKAGSFVETKKMVLLK